MRGGAGGGVLLVGKSCYGCDRREIWMYLGGGGGVTGGGGQITRGVGGWGEEDRAGGGGGRASQLFKRSLFIFPFLGGFTTSCSQILSPRLGDMGSRLWYRVFEPALLPM